MGSHIVVDYNNYINVYPLLRCWHRVAGILLLTFHRKKLLTSRVNWTWGILRSVGNVTQLRTVSAVSHIIVIIIIIINTLSQNF